MARTGYVYFLTNERNTVLYTGVTNDLIRRVAEHKLGLTPGFTSRYRCGKLVYFEAGESIIEALSREKQLKNWRRAWKNDLVARLNPEWLDLSSSIGVTPELLAHLAGDPGTSPGRPDETTVIPANAGIPDSRPTRRDPGAGPGSRCSE